MTVTRAPEVEAAQASADPFTEIRIVSLSATRGANFWSRGPVTRLDIAVGAYDEISSADIPGLTERLTRALPGLETHRCSIGAPGGFVTRLNRGTYAPHIIEHVALELQAMIGHDAGYGRTRGGDAVGQYTVVIEHRHEATGLRAAALALDIVQQAYAGTLSGIDHSLAELHAIAATPDVPPLTPEVWCGVSGGRFRAEFRAAFARRVHDAHDVIVDVSPGFLLQVGLPYARAQVAVVLDTELSDVPERYNAPDRAQRLMSVMVDAVPRGGLVIAPAAAWDVQDAARRERCTVAVFSGNDDVTWKDKKVAVAASWAADDVIVLEHRGRIAARVARDETLVPHVQAALELLTFLQSAMPNLHPSDTHGRRPDRE